MSQVWNELSSFTGYSARSVHDDKIELQEQFAKYSATNRTYIGRRNTINEHKYSERKQSVTVSSTSEVFRPKSPKVQP